MYKICVMSALSKISDSIYSAALNSTADQCDVEGNGKMSMRR